MNVKLDLPCRANRTCILPVLLLLILLASPLTTLDDFDRFSLQIPVPEDTWLAADLYLPDTATVAMPVIFIQTPYNKNRFRLRGPR